MTRIAALALAAGIGAVLLVGCVPSTPVTAEDVVARFDDRIEPAWQIDVEGMFGEPAVLDGLVAVYAQDDEVGMRLEVHDLETGEKLWDHVSSPGGAWGAPLFDETSSVSRKYPIPSIAPLLLMRGEGEKAEPVVVYFERDTLDEVTIVPNDLLHVADARTGDDLEVTIPGYDPDDFDSAYDLGMSFDQQGRLVSNTQSPGRLCGDGPTICFDDSEGAASLALDVGALEMSRQDPVVPSGDSSISPEWGADFARVSEDDVEIARYRDGQQVWRVASDELFDDDRTSPPSIVDFMLVGDLVIIQGYQSITTTPELGNQLDLDYTTSRTVAAVDADTGERRWLLKGGDALCYPVAGYPRDADTEVLPMCLATDGFFSFGYDADEMIDSEDPVVAIAGVDLGDGSIVWQTEHTGEQAISQVTRQGEYVFASRGALAAVPQGDEPGVIDLTDGAWTAAPAKSTFVCRSERDGVQLEFEGSVFAGGGNPIALEYPAGWYAYPCDADGEPVKTWSDGAVRVAGYPAGDDRVLLLTETGVAAFDL